MTNSDLINTVAKRLSFTGVTKKTVKDVVQFVWEAIQDEIREGKEVKLHNFGKFSTSLRACRDPSTGQNMSKPVRIIRFKPAANFKISVR